MDILCCPLMKLLVMDMYIVCSDFCLSRNALIQLLVISNILVSNIGYIMKSTSVVILLNKSISTAMEMSTMHAHDQECIILHESINLNMQYQYLSRTYNN